MWIVDWEYSGMNDPIWDVGDFAVEAKLTPENERRCCETPISAATPTPAELGRYVIYKAMCDLLWTLWGLIQHANENPADDFWAYANRPLCPLQDADGLPRISLAREECSAGRGGIARPSRRACNREVQ